jgi:hypothetical protein
MVGLLVALDDESPDKIVGLAVFNVSIWDPSPGSGFASKMSSTLTSLTSRT